MQTITNSTPISPESPIQVDAEFQALIPPLTKEEFTGLTHNIQEHGFDPLFPILLWNGTIIDGHNRYHICQNLKIPFTTATKEFVSKEDVINWIIDNQFNRRNLTPDQRFYLIGKRYANKKKQIGTNQFTPPKLKDEGVVKNTTPLDPQKTAQTIAEEKRITEKSVRNAEKFAKSIDTIAANMNIKPQELINEKIRVTHKDIAILADLPKETQLAVIEKIKDKPLKEVKEVIKEIKKEDRNADLLQQQQAINEGKVHLPTGKYEIIVMDPPWPYGTEYDPEGRRAANPYPEMSLEEIRRIELPSTEDCILFLWTTHKFMRYSFELLDTWGFRDVMIITWDKEKMGLGSWLRSQSEFCIMAVKGSPKVILTTQTTILHGKAREHSRKPEEFYDMVNNLCIGRKLDYFSRQQRLGWDSMGNEVNKFQGGIQS
jgi:N6-adenosine-specific RNA methylase IME4